MNKPPADWNLDAEGDVKLSIEPDTKLENACTFIIDKEDHTIGNVLRMYLHENDDVLFVGYRVPHPLTHAVHLKVHCVEGTPPARAVDLAIDQIFGDLQSLEHQFQEQLERVRRREDGGML
eukprot:TRINITY_DN2062_c0_g1_i1.p3 TRINITY_DN2062_c0_g1~~TRINITY_DN2062_c0_g1_i1.p3  ORF type:complete len:138 (-),score=68.05 TRINITY_DN2062_c0_g1_i1:25-387(-)